MSNTDFYLEEAKIVQSGFLKIVEIFFHWFTWFFGANLLSMSWVVSGEKHVHGGPLLTLAAVWMICTGLGIFACRMLGKYTRETKARLDSLTNNLGSFDARTISLAIGFKISNYAWQATMWALMVTYPAWLFLVLWYWGEEPLVLKWLPGLKM